MRNRQTVIYAWALQGFVASAALGATILAGLSFWASKDLRAVFPAVMAWLTFVPIRIGLWRAGRHSSRTTAGQEAQPGSQP